MNLITDQYGRTFKTLRVSLLSRCNLGCTYCVDGEPGGNIVVPPSGNADPVANVVSHPGEKAEIVVREDQKGMPFLLELIKRLHQRLAFRTVRLTGGEPLLYPDLIDLIGNLHAMEVDVRLTTNGTMLKRLAAPMKKAGMRSINVSLDAMEEDIFFRMSRRRSVQRVIDGIDAALEAGLEVKINAVIMRDMNDSQIIPLMEFAGARGIRIRFLELMQMGHLYTQHRRYLFTQHEILSVISGRYRFNSLGRAGHATTHYWQTAEGQVFGVIANDSEPFCIDCDRLRLDSQGNIYGCLSSNHPIALHAGEDDQVLEEKLQRALFQKQAVRFAGSELSMLHIGG